MSAQPWLARLVGAIPAARAGADPEGVHQLRVALARLDVWLALGGWRALRRDVRWLRRRAAAVRDLDVRLGQSPPESIAEDCRRLRAAAQHELAGALDSPRSIELVDALTALPPLGHHRARRAVARLTARTLARGRRAMARPHNLAALHTLRRAVRRLRFAIEWTGPSLDALATLQGAIGQACDRSVALEALRAEEHRGSRTRAYRRELRRELRAKMLLAGELWKQTRGALERLS